MEGPVEFVAGIATGTRNLLGSVIGGAAGALSKVTQTASKGLATLTLDDNYQNARIQRKELQSQTTPELVASGKNTIKVDSLLLKFSFDEFCLGCDIRSERCCEETNSGRKTSWKTRIY